MNLNYTVGIPAAPNNPSVDQSPMQTNTNSIDAIIKIDHFGFNDNLGGYHNIIHQPNKLTDPARITNINQTYAKSYIPDTTGGVGDTQLFSETGLGLVSQLTGFSTTDKDDGWQWVGGILIQWGFVTFSLGSGVKTSTVTFKDRVVGAIPFPNKCFEVLATLSSFNGNPPIVPGSVVSIPGGQISRTDFTWYVISTGNYNGLSWLAIGN